MSSKYQYTRDWKFPYGNITETDKPIDPKYLKHVQELFKCNGGNGWWWYATLSGKRKDMIPKRFRLERSGGHIKKK